MHYGVVLFGRFLDVLLSVSQFDFLTVFEQFEGLFAIGHRVVLLRLAIALNLVQLVLVLSVGTKAQTHTVSRSIIYLLLSVPLGLLVVLDVAGRLHL